MNQNIRQWARNDPFSAGHLNESLPTVRSVRTITGANGIEVTQTEAGTTIRDERPPAAVAELFLATIVDKGPDNDADYSDSRYWARMSRVTNGGTYDNIAVTDIVAPTFEREGGYTAKTFAEIVTVTNIVEWADGTHLLDTDGSRLVKVWGFYDAGDSSGGRGHRFVMSEATPDDVGELFFVNLSNDGGSNGDKTHAASYTYTATDLNGTTLGTLLSPIKPRPNGTATVATAGIGYYDTGGGFVLAEAYEKYGTGSC